MPEHTGLRVAYVADTMAGMQMLAGLAERVHLTLVSPAALGDDATNFWPPPDGVTIARVQLPGGRLAFPLRAARWLARNRHRYDVAIALDSLVGALGANLGHTLGGPPVVLQVGRPTVEYVRCRRDAHPGLANAVKVALRVALARLLVALNERRAAAIGAVSEYVAAACGRRNDSVVAIGWWGVDTKRFRAQVSRQEARRRLGLPLDDPVVMWRSRVGPEKDPDTFLRAMARLRGEGRRFCVVYMGGEIAEMEARAAALGVEIESGKPATPDEIPLWYVAADVNVQTSRSEGLGVSVLESLACGTPVVVSAAGGLPETVAGGQCGLVAPVGDAAATAAAIARYLDDHDLARRHAAAGRDHVRAHYEHELVFDAWAALVSGVARRPDPSTANDAPAEAVA